MINENSSCDNLINNIIAIAGELKLSRLLRVANFKKRDGIGASVYAVFLMLLCSCFFRGNKTVHGNYTSVKQANNKTSKSSLYRFLSEPTHNWRKLLFLLAASVISKLRKLSDHRKFCLVVDDSVLERPKASEVELLARLYDHVFHRFVKGFNCLQIGWTDGCSFIPVANALMSSSKQENRYRDADKKIDHRTCGYKLRQEAQFKKPNVVYSLIKSALSFGIDADYLLCDTWFTNEPFLKHITKLGLDVIGMVKNLKQRYICNGQRYTLPRLFSKVLVKRRSGDIIGSLEVTTANGIPVKLVYIRNRNIKRQYLVLLSTDVSLKDEEIVRLYARRWLIETNFRAQKQYFKLGVESQGRDYDNSVSFVHIASIRYIMAEFARRNTEDPKCISDWARDTCEQMEDIPYISAIESLMRCFENLASELNKAGFLKPGSLAKAQAFINDRLSSWFTGINRYLQNLFERYNIPTKIQSSC